MGEFCFINSYLFVTINAMVSYIDRLVVAKLLEENELVETLKYVNNMLKHNPHFVRIVKPNGDMSFPECFENEIIYSEVTLFGTIA